MKLFAILLLTVSLMGWSAQTAGANSLPYYWLPWTYGGSRKVEQGNNEYPSHKGNCTYAWDFSATVNNWLVRAARGGVVSAVKDNSSIGGCSRDYDGYENYVKIDTGDGYETLYAHLQYASVGGKITEGEVITAYEPIGNTDNTGYSCGDHLHYQVQTPCSGSFCTSVSSSFLDPDVLRQNPDGIPRTPQSVISGNHAKGTDGIGFYKGNGEWHLRNALTGNGGSNYITVFGGHSGDIPVTGDWDGH